MAKNSHRAFAALSLSLVLGLARAQDSVDQDPPDRAARLSYLSGDVAMQPAGEDEWAPAIVNRPLTTGDKLWTERGARAEIYVGQASVRLDGDTGFSFLNVDDDTIQMRMTAGVIVVNVRELDGNDHIEIDTPNIALSVLRPGSYRVEVNDAGDATVVRVSEGEAEADGPGQNVIVHAQQVATFRGVDQLVADWGSLGSPDDFDRWNLERERRDERVASSRTAEYVSPDVTGYEDLDDNGSWSNEADYGYVWTPTRVVAGWSPYRYGRWVWISPWGWSWIDDAPWGYAPFHYGRWAHVRDRWCWVPGPRHVRAVYAPALVGWVGSPGLNVSVSVGGGVGWFPLGPREVYVPGRRFSHRYVERVNVSNTVIVNRTVINNVYVNGARNVTYRNRNVPGGFTAVSRNTFVTGGRTGDRQARIDERELSRATVSNGPQLLPGRESRLGGPARVNVRVPPRTVVDRQVIVKREPPAANARFARARGNEDVASRPTERFQRPPDPQQNRPQERGPRNDGNRNDVVLDRNRNDRPVRGNPPSDQQPNGQQQNGQQNPPEQRSFQERSRDDRPPKQRDERGDDRSFERERQARQQEQQAETQQRWRTNNDQQREQQQREQQQRDQQQRDQQQRGQQQEREQQNRERFQRQQDSERQAATARQAEARQAEARQRNDERQRDSQRQQQERQQQEHQQQERQQQDRQRNEQRQNRPEPKHQDDKPRTPPKDQDSPRPNRE